MTGPTATQAGVSWPLQTTLTLGALPTAAGCARLHARNVISEWGQAALADNVELVVSELVTNAVLASTYPDGRPRYEEGAGLPRVHLRLSSDRVRVLIEVWDQDLQPPTPKTAGPDEEGGRGSCWLRRCAIGGTGSCPPAGAASWSGPRWA